MTRAAERLVVCGTQGRNKIPDGCWYQLVEDALKPLSKSEPADFGGGEVLRYRKGDAEPLPAAKPAEEQPAEIISLPEWLTHNAAPDRPEMGTATPSSVEEDDARSFAGGGGAALLRGSLLHRLMQSLPDIPPERRAKAAEDYLNRSGGDLPVEDRAAIAGQVMRILGDARFAELFGPNSRAEVPIVGQAVLAGKAIRVSGQIDRLAVTQDFVLIGDFKTNRPALRRIEDVPPQYVRQLALYRAVLAQLYPGKPLRAALVWTEVPDLMALSDEALDAALSAITPA